VVLYFMRVPVTRTIRAYADTPHHDSPKSAHDWSASYRLSQEELPSYGMRGQPSLTLATHRWVRLGAVITRELPPGATPASPTNCSVIVHAPASQV
jgi:hypothetical protein